MALVDEKYMKMALQLAERARGRTSPNPMVGAVIVKDGVVVGEGYHQKAGTPHAEVHALATAGQQSRGATMYVNLEPCSHYGRTPPCSAAIIKAGLARVVVAMTDPNPAVAGGGLRQLREAGIEVREGVLEEEAKVLNEIFIKYITGNRPFVLVKSAMTLDGKIAATTGDSRWVTGPESRELVHRWRDSYGAILVGIGTVLADDPLLTCRLEGQETRNPIRIVLDSQGRIPLETKILDTAGDVPTIIVGGSNFPVAKIKAIEKKGAEVLVLQGRDGRPDLDLLLEELFRREISSLFVEGGASVNASFFAAGLVDKVAWFIAPKIIGGQAAPGPVGDMGIELMSQALGIKELTVERVGKDLLLTGYPQYSRGGERCHVYRNR